MQKSISQIITTVCRELSLPAPATIISSNDPNVQLLLAFATAVKDDLTNEFDWQALETGYSFTTVEGVDEYSFPNDIKRWINGTFFDKTNRWEMRGPLTPREWVFVHIWQVAGTPFERFRVQGDKIILFPTPGVTPITFNCVYLSDHAVIDGSTTLPKADFTQDSDRFRLDARLMVYGIKLKYLSSKGQPTGDALADYNRALNAAKSGDAPARRLSLLPACPGWLLSTANIPDGNWGL